MHNVHDVCDAADGAMSDNNYDAYIMMLTDVAIYIADMGYYDYRANHIVANINPLYIAQHCSLI